ncbi:GMC family oxidoreductase N-terminal domain-containing protein [Streptomyces sp. INA 01156]
MLVVDAGPLPRGAAGFGPALLDARLVPGAQPDHPATHAHPVHLTGAAVAGPRGRVLGGSSTVNGGYFVRARREDFDRWAAAGNPAWSCERMLPFLRALENDLDHGAGPCTVPRARCGSGAVAWTIRPPPCSATRPTPSVSPTTPTRTTRHRPASAGARQRGRRGASQRRAQLSAA